MDRKYIENEHVVDRYLAGELTVREARDFEQYCLDHPEALREMPIPVRLKARLARRPADDSETGVFKAIPSSVTRAALEATEDGFDPDDPDEQREETQRSHGGGNVSRLMAIGLAVALLGALGGTVHYAMKAGSLESQLKQTERAARAVQMQAPSGQVRYRVQPVRAKPSGPTLALGWLAPPQLIDLHIDVTQTKFQQFQITIDKVDGGRVMQLRRVARDSNGEVRLGLNSSAFGPGDYLLKIDGLTWKGQAQDYGWVMLGLE